MISASAPAGWKEKKLSDCLEKLIDYRGKSTPKDSFGYQLITARNVRFGHIEFESKEYMNPSDYKEWMTRGFPEPNDVLFTTEAPLGNVALYPSEGTYALAQRLVTLRPNKDELDSVYLFYYLLSDYAQNQVRIRATGSTATGIRQSELRKVPVIFPPLTEQRKIAEILSTWDEAIAKTGQLIAALQTRKKSLMQRLLTGEVRFPGFDGEWEGVRLQDVIEINYGKSPKEIRDENGEFPIFGTGGIVGFTNEPLCKQNSVIIGRKGSIDQPQLSLTPYWAIDTTFYCTPKNGLDVRWLYYYLSHKGLARYNEGSTIPSLSRTTLRSLKLFLPSPDEQRKIADVLQESDLEINLHLQRVESINQQKKGLMQRLLTGQVRVEVDDEVGRTSSEVRPT